MTGPLVRVKRFLQRRATGDAPDGHTDRCARQKMNTSTKAKAMYGHSLLHSPALAGSWDKECLREEHDRVKRILKGEYGVKVHKGSYVGRKVPEGAKVR